jgi:hypothetical protein
MLLVACGPLPPGLDVRRAGETASLVAFPTVAEAAAWWAAQPDPRGRAGDAWAWATLLGRAPEGVEATRWWSP